MNPYETPTAPQTPDIQRVTRAQIIAGETTAGPLLVWILKYPVRFWVILSTGTTGIIIAFEKFVFLKL